MKIKAKIIPQEDIKINYDSNLFSFEISTEKIMNYLGEPHQKLSAQETGLSEEWGWYLQFSEGIKIIFGFAPDVQRVGIWSDTINIDHILEQIEIEKTNLERIDSFPEYWEEIKNKQRVITRH